MWRKHKYLSWDTKPEWYSTWWGEYISENFAISEQWSSLGLYFFQCFHTSLTNSIEQSSWEANMSSPSQEIPCILWNRKVHYRIEKHLPPVSIMSQISPSHAPPSHILKINFNIILLSMSKSCKRSLSPWSPHQNALFISPVAHTCQMPHPSHSSWLDHQKNIWWGVQIIKLLIV